MLAHTHGAGGESQFVDGFAAAEHLRRQDPEAYEILSRVRFFSHASGNEGISIQPANSKPVFIHHRVTGNLLQICWNNADRAAFDLDVQAEAEIVEDWYRAARFDSHLVCLNGGRRLILCTQEMERSAQR